MTTTATTTAALALAPASNLTPWSATPLRSTATLVWTRRGAGTATTVSTSERVGRLPRNVLNELQL